jgi:hypothetical protein
MNCFIPFVGWIFGAILDLRGLIANTVKGDWVAAGMSVVGVVPYLGDTANIIALTMDDLPAIDKLRRACKTSFGKPQSRRTPGSPGTLCP